LGDEWAWSGGHAQLVTWAAGSVRPGDVEACAASQRQQPPPDAASASWRSRGFQNIPYPGPGGNSWSDYQNLAGQLYTNAAAADMWRAHAAFLISHVNPYTGLAYKEDDRIMSWQLSNEPRAGTDVPAFLRWLSDSSSFVKQHAPKQLVCSGMEGDTSYFSRGQSVLDTQGILSLDFVTAHLWVENWEVYQPAAFGDSAFNATIAWAQAYIAATAFEAATLHKPIVLEEFGLPRDLGSFSPSAPTTRRDAYFRAIFKTVVDSAASQGVLAGASFWAYSGAGRPRAGGIPGTRAQLCEGAHVDGAAAASFSGASPYWPDCFSSQGERVRACPSDSWWTPHGSGGNITTPPLLGDPPHESQGWYGVYDSDASTLAVVAEAAGRLRQLRQCAADALQGGAPACTAHIQPGPGGNLC